MRPTLLNILITGLLLCIATSSAFADVQCWVEPYSKTGFQKHTKYEGCNACWKDNEICIERCYSYTYTCTASGYNKVGGAFRFKARADNKKKAEKKTINACTGSYSNCEIDFCETRRSKKSATNCEDFTN